MADEHDAEGPDFQVTDKRFWATDDSVADRAGIPEPKYPSFVEELKARTEAAEAKLREKLTHVDEENAAYRSRLNRQLEERLMRGRGELVRDLLEVVDNFERALECAVDASSFEALRDGVALNLSLLVARLRNWGVEPVENLGHEFDPDVAEALTVVAVESPEKDNRVVEIVQRGYRFGDQLLRPALVKVGRYEGNAGDDRGVAEA